MTHTQPPLATSGPRPLVRLHAPDAACEEMARRHSSVHARPQTASVRHCAGAGGVAPAETVSESITSICLETKCHTHRKAGPGSPHPEPAPQQVR